MIVRRTISKEEISQMPKASFPGKIVVVQTEQEAEKAIRFLNSNR